MREELSTAESLVVTSCVVGGRRLRENAISTSVVMLDSTSNGKMRATACDRYCRGDDRVCASLVETSAGSVIVRSRAPPVRLQWLIN